MRRRGDPARPSFERLCFAFAIAPATSAIPVFVFYAAPLALHVRSDNIAGWLAPPAGLAVIAGAFA